MQILGEGILFDKKELRLTICRGHWISQWVVFEKKVVNMYIQCHFQMSNKMYGNSICFCNILTLHF